MDKYGVRVNYFNKGTKMGIKPNILTIVLFALLATSCVTSRRVDYLQDMTQGSQIELEDRFEARIAPYDELIIRVSSSQPNQELAAPFNVGLEGNVYLVDVNGDIEFPVVGKLHVAGFTRMRVQEILKRMLEQGDYLDDPYVMVRFKTFKIFVLGNGGGKVINVTNERCTFLEALAMMGGLDNYTRRDRIAVMREVNGRMVMRYLDPRSSAVFNDPFFMMQQNDFIILDGVSGGTMRQEVTYWSTFFSTLVSSATLILTLGTYLKNK